MDGVHADDRRALEPAPADGGAPRYVDVPASEVVAEGSPVELRWQTPCGEAVRSFPLPAPAFNEQGVMIVRVPPTLAAPPPRTRVFFPREMRGTVTIGDLTLEAPKTAEVADLACAKTATIGGVTAALPALEPPLAEEERRLHAGGDATTAILVTDDPAACFVDEIVAFGGGEWAKSWSRQLTGERVYVLAFATYDVFFEAIPDEVQVRLGTEGTSRTSLTRCAAP